MKGALQFTRALLCLSLLPALAACDQKDLCMDHREHTSLVEVDVKAAWQLSWEYQYENGPQWQQTWPADHFGMSYDALRPARPEGLRALVYTHGQNPDSRNIGADGGKIYMHRGDNQLLFYNNDTEYIIFNDIHTLASATATTRARARSTYIGSPVMNGREENTVNPPDYLFGHYIDNYTAAPTMPPPVLDITMKPLVFSYLVRCPFDAGLQYVAVARGAFAGVAATVYLDDGHTGQETATVLFDFRLTDYGVEAVVNSFGAPGYPNGEYSRTDGVYGMNLEVRLKNGKIKTWDFDISSLMEYQPRGGVIELPGVSISDEEGREDSGTFGVEVDGWDDYEDIPVVFGPQPES